MSIHAPTDPLSIALPPLVVGRYRSPDGRAEVALRSSVWLDGAWWSCLDRTFQAGAGFLVPHRHAHTDEVHFVRDGTVHADPWATKDGPATVTSLLSPAAREWIDFGVRVGEATRRGQLTHNGQPPLPVVMRIVHETGADVLAPGLPAALQPFVAIPALAAIGRLFWKES